MVGIGLFSVVAAALLASNPSEWPAWILLYASFVMLPFFISFRRDPAAVWSAWLAIAAHHAVAIVNAFGWYEFIGSTADAVNFHEAACAWVASGDHDFRVGARFFETMLGIAYSIAGRSQLLGNELSVFAFSISCIILIRISRLLDPERSAAAPVLAFGLLPAQVIFGSLTLRESWEILFFMYAVYGFLRLKLRQEPAAGVKALAACLALGMLHNGLIIYAAFLAMLGLFFRLGQRTGLNFQKVAAMGVACVFIAGLAYVALTRTLPSAPSVEAVMSGDAASYASRYRKGGEKGARAEYGVKLDVSSPAGAATTVPALFALYMLAPLPWQIAKPLDVYAAAEGWLRLALLLFAFRTMMKAKGERKRVLAFLLTLYLSVTFLFAMGTINWGTAIRHHLIGNWLLFLAGLPAFGARLKSFARPAGAIAAPAAALVILLAPPTQAAEETRLCRGGIPELAVVTARGASAASREAARDLAQVLGRMCGLPFGLTEGPLDQGIAVGTALEFGRPVPAGIEHREAYSLHSRAQGLEVVAATEAGVSDAVWGLLHELGYRQFFPGEAWEIVPRSPDLKAALAVETRPSYLSRSIWYGFGLWDHNEAAYRDWLKKNRLPGAFKLKTGHSFENLIERNAPKFKEHPEYLALVGGSRRGPQLCLANEDLRRLIVEDALRRVEEDPASDSVSVEPADGEGWCRCGACRALGSHSDRALVLANEVAGALAAKGKRAAFYAYHTHSEPPSRTAQPGVIVSIATEFLPKGRTAESLIEGWTRQGVKEIGIREYYGVHQWHRDLPGRAKGADLSYLAASIPRYHALGARHLSAESSDNWGANGLGYYVAARLLWDVREAADAEAIVDDFLAKSFGKAREPMARFYELIDGARKLKKTEVPSDLVSRMYGLLREARALDRDPAVQRRLDELLLYARYVELYREYDGAWKRRGRAFDELARHTMRIRSTMMVHAKAFMKDAGRHDLLIRRKELGPLPPYGAQEIESLWQGSAR